jgi:cholest-4-en-3-one 26-monooxygenase
MRLSDIDILDPGIYESGVPHASFEYLRREAPVFWHAEPGGSGFWAVTKHEDVIAVLKDAATFSSELAGTQIPDLPKEDVRRSPEVLAIMDPPRHTRYRAIVGQSFTTHGLAQSEAYVGKLVTSLVSEVRERGQFDFITDFAARLPMAIILNMVGVPDSERTMLNDWVMKLLATDDPEFAVSDEERALLGGRFMAYAHALAAERREKPRDDLLSVLMAAEVDGQRLRYEEFGMFFMLLLAAGTDTPRLILGSAMQALLQDPTLRTRLVESPELLDNAIEETLRFHPPLVHFRRTTTRDTTIRGSAIGAGQKVVAWLCSANRDEDVFDAPQTFDITRSGNRHVSFGYGPHFCIGNALARITAKVALNECLRRLPSLEFNGPVERLRSNWLNGPKRMPVKVGSER